MRTILTVCLFSLLHFSAHANCNWAAIIKSFKVTPDCNPYHQTLSGGIDLYERKDFIDLTWNVNGNKSSHEASFSHGLSYNGKYIIKLTLSDRIYNCDTTLTDSVAITCLASCNWKRMNAYLTYNAYCGGPAFKPLLHAVAGVGAFPSDYYKFEWFLNDSSISRNEQELYYQWRSTGTTTLCVKITDTILNCDTTLCYSRNVSCPIYDSTGGWDAYFDSMYVLANCSEALNGNSIEGLLYTRNAGSPALRLEAFVNGIPLSPVATFGSPQKNLIHKGTYYPPGPGIYQFCFKIRDIIQNRDTTICRTINYTCKIPVCKWSKFYTQLRTYDSCKTEPLNLFHIGAFVYMIAPNIKQNLKYEWSVNSSVNQHYSKSDAFHYTGYSSGTYDVCVRVSDTVNSCDTTMCQSLTVNCSFLSVEALSNGTLKVYPNPVHSSFNLDWDKEPSHLFIIDLTGRVRQVHEIHPGPNSIDIPDLERGLYFIRIASSDGIFTTRLLKH